nr:NACHT, LRR and PYD domains-containing protein 1b allele 2-like [Salvelinus alpinus]
MQYTQGGPLLDITMEFGELEEGHLQHLICLGSNPSLGNNMKILHVEEHGVSFEEVHEVTRFHVKLLRPKFSALSLSYPFFWDVELHCNVVLYLAVTEETLISRLYLLLRNSSQQEAVQKQEEDQTAKGYSRFLLSSPNGPLKLKSNFVLQNPHARSIKPQKIQLLPEDNEPSHFKMVMDNTGIDIQMELIGDDGNTVWDDILWKAEYSDDTRSMSLTSPVTFLKNHRAEIIQRATNAMPIADYLISKGMISDEDYTKIEFENTVQDKFRKLLKCAIKEPKVACGFLKVFKEQSPYLFEDLEKPGT